MHSPAALRTDTEALCSDIKQLAQQLRAVTITFEDAQQLWESAYRPKARKLNDAMLYYVPDGDPSIQVEFRDGNHRQLKSSDQIMIDWSLSASTAADHLELISRKLLELTAYLPTVTDVSGSG